MAAGLSLGAMVTLDQNLGKPPAALVGWPFTYQVIPRTATGVPRFDAGALAADIAIAAALLASACITTQVMACRLAPSARWTIRSACLWIVGFALYLGLLRTAWLALVYLLLAGLLYALASPVLLLLIWIGLRGVDRQEGS